MKIFIVRLNGKILTEYPDPQSINRTQPSSKQQFGNGSSSVITSSSCNSPNSSIISSQSSITEEDEALTFYHRKTLIAQVIEHSRKLSLAQYDHQLNYTRIRGKDYFYLARHKVLFIYGSQGDDYSVLAVQNILNNVVRLYEITSLNIFNGNKLPNQLTDYQRDQLKKLSCKIDQIVSEEDSFELVRKTSIRLQTSNQSHLRQFLDIGQRQKQIVSFTASDKEKKIKQEHINFHYQTEKNLNKLRIKMCLLCMLSMIVVAFSCYLLIFDSNCQII